MNTINGYPCDQITDMKYSPYYEKQVTQQTILLPGGGCAYYRAKKGNACTFCAFPGFTRDVIKGPGFENSFKSWKLDYQVYKNMYDNLTCNNNNVDRVAIFNGGSFFPDSELPTEFQKYVCQQIAQHSNARQLFVEAYPSFISRSKLKQTLEHLNGKDLLVGIGFESRDSRVRNDLLNKSIDLDLFENKIKMMQELGVQSFVYVFLKAHELTEWQAYKDAINTISYLHSLGVNEITLSCAFVPEGTKLEKEYRSGNFRPPWLWTILDIMKEAEKNNWPLIIGGFDDTPPPIAGPSNCEKCNSIIFDLINQSRKTGKLIPNKIPSCSCHSLWEEEMKNKRPYSRIF